MTPEVRDLGEEFRKPKLEEVMTEYLSRVVTDPTVVVIEDADAFEEISFEASAGSRARLLVRSEEVPNRVLPALGRLRRPDGTDGDKGRRLVRRGGQVVEHPSATIDASILVASDEATSGSVIEKHERISPSSSGRSHFAFCSSVAKSTK